MKMRTPIIVFFYSVWLIAALFFAGFLIGERNWTVEMGLFNAETSKILVEGKFPRKEPRDPVIFFTDQDEPYWEIRIDPDGTIRLLGELKDHPDKATRLFWNNLVEQSPYFLAEACKQQAEQSESSLLIQDNRPESMFDCPNGSISHGDMWACLGGRQEPEFTTSISSKNISFSKEQMAEIHKNREAIPEGIMGF